MPVELEHSITMLMVIIGAVWLGAFVIIHYTVPLFDKTRNLVFLIIGVFALILAGTAVAMSVGIQKGYEEDKPLLEEAYGVELDFAPWSLGTLTDPINQEIDVDVTFPELNVTLPGKMTVDFKEASLTVDYKGKSIEPKIAANLISGNEQPESDSEEEDGTPVEPTEEEEESTE